MAKHRDTLTALRRQNEALRLTLENKRLSQFVAKYDVLEAPAQKKRRQPVVERQSEEKLLRLYDRLRGINLARDLERNFTAAKAAMRQFRVNVIGDGPKLQFHTDDEAWNKEAASWFNAEWTKDCDFRDDLHFSDQLKNALAAVKREGDTLAVMDDALIEDTGKLLWWEADQLVRISDLETNGGPWAKLCQESGVIYDKWGRVLGYAVTSEHGMDSVPYAQCTIFPREYAKLLRSTWRANQKRGVGDVLTISADLQDLYEMRSKEMQTAKLLASFAGVVKKEGAASEVDLKRAMQGESNTEVAPDQAAYERLGALTGGYLEYMEPGDSFDPLNFDRPSVNFLEANDFILRSAGAALGLSKTYTTLNTEASYTAFRGDLLLSWAQFKTDQKYLERSICDWAARKAIAHRVRTQGLATPPKGWEKAMSWKWPEQPSVDPLKEASAAVMRLGHLLSTYSDEVGPEWSDKMAQAAKEMETAIVHGLPQKIFDGITKPQIEGNGDIPSGDTGD